MTTETSNARGEVPESVEFWAARLEMLADLHGCGSATMRESARLLRELAATPPPAAARGDVRGLVAKWRAEAEVGEFNAAEAASVGAYVPADIGDARAKVRRELADELESALAAEGVQAGEVEVVYQARWDAVDGKPWEDITLEQYDVLQSTEAVTRILYTAPQQPEARGVVDAVRIDALHEKWMLDDDMRSFGEVLAALEAAREDAEDAARYRWLRDSPERPCRVPCAYAVMPGDVEHPTPIGGATLDTAIDQARGKAGQEVGDG